VKEEQHPNNHKTKKRMDDYDYAILIKLPTNVKIWRGGVSEMVSSEQK
jgi:hypothetical protein